MMGTEKWETVTGYEGRYEVSSKGRVRSVSRTATYITGKRAIVRGRVLSQSRRQGKCNTICLMDADGARKTMPIHRLVLNAFVGPRPGGMVCCHNNGNPHDNRLKNLRWDTQTNNHLDKRRHGTAAWGERNPQAKLTRNQVVEIRERVAAGELQRVVGAEFGVTQPTVSEICSGKNWTHVRAMRGTNGTP